MRIILVLLSCTLLPGCLETRTAVEGVGGVADKSLDAGRAAFCGKRFSLRAYEEFAKRHGKTAAELRTWCGWDLDDEVMRDPL